MSKLHHYCRTCSDAVDPRRWALGIKFCMPCGDEIAKQRKFTVVPMNKSNYIACFERETLKQLNPKRTT
jgi:ribosomal protein L37AE/L43A